MTAPVSRRDFLKDSGVLIVTFGAAGLAGPVGVVRGDAAAQGAPAANRQLDSWLAVAADGTVTAYTGKCELGQGMQTAQTQLIAEELSVPLDRVRLIQCDTALTPDQGTTSGSQSHPTNFNDGNLALAGATARMALLELAAKRLGVPVEGLTLSAGVIAVAAEPSRRATYGDLIGGRRFEIPLDRRARRKPSSEWSVLGKPVPRLDSTALATGRFEFVHNVRVPGMLHGRVVRPPAVGATLAAVDERSIRDLPGIVKVVVRNNFVGVVAEKPWHAAEAAGTLKVTWTGGGGLPNHASYYDNLRSRKPTRDTFVVNSRDVDETLARASALLKATYLHPYQMHGSMGTSCAVADVRGDTATIWSPTQSLYPQRSTLAKLLGLAPENVHVLFRMGSGCYGINGADTVTYDAALMSQAVGRPVRVQLSRRDEMAWENYGYAYVIDQRVGVDAEGRIAAWDYEAWYPTRGGRPGYETPGNVVTGFLAGFEPAPFTPRAAQDVPDRFGNGSNAAPSYVAGCAGGACGGTGTVRSERVLAHVVISPFWTGPLRSPSRLQNTFAHECFMDEVAAHVKADPVDYRLRHLRDPRLIAVVNAAAKTAKWDSRPSPAPPAREGAVAAGRGIACVLYEGDNGYCAIVAEVNVDRRGGEVAVKRLVIAHDCGPISNPDGLRSQIEGGALQGLSRALVEEVVWDQEKITSVDWRSYPTLSLAVPMPVCEIVLINQATGEAMGAGETSITLVAAAVGNAIFDATGVRLRQVPFTPARVREALATPGRG
jgi:CO/xanthine dehydrogenase Mo-binding subunit